MNDEDPIPRDLIALVILHAMIAGGDGRSFTQSTDRKFVADIAYEFADAMIKRGEA